MRDRIFLCFADPPDGYGLISAVAHRDDTKHTCQTCLVSNDGPLGAFQNCGAFSHNLHCHTNIASNGSKCVVLNII